MDVHDIAGIHHITTTGQDLTATRAFYRGVLKLMEMTGLPDTGAGRVVTFSCNAPLGRAASALTVFASDPGPQLRRGYQPPGAIVLGVPPGRLVAWQQHLADSRVNITGRAWSFGEEHLCFTDPDGLDLAFVEEAVDSCPDGLWAMAPEPLGVVRLRTVELPIHDGGDELQRLLKVLGLSPVAREGPLTRFLLPGPRSGARIDLFPSTPWPNGSSGAGRIGRLAFQVTDANALLRLSKAIAGEGFPVLEPPTSSGMVWVPVRSSGIFVALCLEGKRPLAARGPEGAL